MGLETLLATREAAVVTAVAAPEIHPLQPEPAPHKAVTAVTDVTAQIRKSQPETTAARCVDCQHAEPVEHYPALNHCAAGIESGNPTGAWWSLDTHDCGAFKALSGIYAAILEQAPGGVHERRS